MNLQCTSSSRTALSTSRKLLVVTFASTEQPALRLRATLPAARGRPRAQHRGSERAQEARAAGGWRAGAARRLRARLHAAGSALAGGVRLRAGRLRRGLKAPAADLSSGDRDRDRPAAPAGRG